MGEVGVGVVAARWIEGGQVAGSAASCFGDLLMAWFWQGQSSALPFASRVLLWRNHAACRNQTQDPFLTILKD